MSSVANNSSQQVLSGAMSLLHGNSFVHAASCAIKSKLPSGGMLLEIVLALAVIVLFLFRFAARSFADVLGGQIMTETLEELASCAYLTLGLIFLEVQAVRQARKRARDLQGELVASTNDMQWLVGLLCFGM